MHDDAIAVRCHIILPGAVNKRSVPYMYEFSSELQWIHPDLALACSQSLDESREGKREKH